MGKLKKKKSFTGVRILKINMDSCRTVINSNNEERTDAILYETILKLGEHSK